MQESIRCAKVSGLTVHLCLEAESSTDTASLSRPIPQRWFRFASNSWALVKDIVGCADVAELRAFGCRFDEVVGANGGVELQAIMRASI